MGKLFSNPKTRIRNLIIIISVFLVLAGVFAFVSIKSASGLVNNLTGNTSKNDYDSIESMNYHLRSNATEYQKELFKELKDLVNDGTNKEAIATSVAKNFVADFYTWTNKEGTYDIGGIDYVYSPSKSVIYHQARNQFYKYLTYFINEYGADDLLEVISIETELPQKTNYELEGKTYDAYSIACRWEYKESKEFFSERYYKKEYLTIIDNNGRFEIVQAYGDE